MNDRLESDPENEQTRGLAAWNKPKAVLPVPNQGLGLSADSRVRASRKRVGRVASNLLGGPDRNRAEAKKVWIELLAITRTYWADWDRDKQTTFGDIKANLRNFRRRLISMLEALDELAPAVRRELNSDRMFLNGDRVYKDYVGEVRAEVDQLRAATDHVAAPKYAKVKAVAVARCCSGLAAVWEETTSQRFARTKEFDLGSRGSEFTAAGVRFVQLAMNAIDSNVGFKQVHSWLTDKTQVESRKK